MTFEISCLQTTLELVACVAIAVRYALDIADVLGRYQYPGPAGMTFCVLLYSSTLFTLALHGGTASIVVITLDRYWKIVHPVNHRKYHRCWMTFVGVFLPWLNGVAIHLIPVIASTRIVNGTCVTPAFRTKVFAMISISFTELKMLGL